MVWFTLVSVPLQKMILYLPIQLLLIQYITFFIVIPLQIPYYYLSLFILMVPLWDIVFIILGTRFDNFFFILTILHSSMFSWDISKWFDMLTVSQWNLSANYWPNLLSKLLWLDKSKRGPHWMSTRRYDYDEKGRFELNYSYKNIKS